MADDSERLIVLLEARIRDFERNMQKAAGTADQSYSRMRRDSKSATAQMEADMLRSTSRINQALAGASLKIGAYGKAFAAGLIGSVTAVGVDGVVRAVRGLVREVASLGDEAARAGVSVKVFQEWKAVATATRVPLDAMVDAFKELSIRADEFAATGKGSAAEAFGRLGMSRDEVKEKLRDPAKLMLELIERTRQLKNAAAATRIFDEMFGGTGAEQLVRLLGMADGEIGNIIQSAHEAGAIFDEEMIRKADEMDRRWNAAWTNFELGAKAAIFNSIDFMTQLERKMAEVGNSDFFMWLAGKVADSGWADPSITLDRSKIDAATGRLNVKELEQRAELLEKQIANLKDLGFDAADAVRELATVRAQLEAEVAAILGSTGRGTIGETSITLPEIEVSPELGNATKFMEEYRKQLALSVRERSIAAETQRILNQANSEGIQITEEQARALASEKEARDEREAASRRGLATLEKEIDKANEYARTLRQFEDDLIFEREQMFRSPIDQRVFAEIRSLGLDINSIEGQRIADNIRINEQIAEQIDLAEQLGDALADAASNFLQDIFSGRDAMESLVSIGRRFASTNFDAFVKGMGNLFSGKGFKLDTPSVGANIPSIVQTGAALGQGVAPVLSKTLSPIGVEITKAAGQLGVSARDLATVISYETGGTFSTSKWGGKNGDYLGLIQFGPEERQKFGAYWGQAFGDQMQAAVRYFKARGLQPGMGIRDLYSTVLTGSPGNYNRSDGYGTVDQHLAKMLAHQAKADKILDGLPDAVKGGALQGTQRGAQTGVQKAFDPWIDSDGTNLRQTTAGQGGSFGFQGAMGLLGAGLGGFSTGYQSANPLMGALGGAMQGMGAVGQLAAMGIAISPVVGAVVGGAGGRIGAILNGART